jgi:hypothetical protein
VTASGFTLALAGAAVLIVAGCGGGRLSHDDYVARADAVCSAYQKKVGLLTHAHSYDDVIAYADRTLPLYMAALDKLRALRPPSSDEAAVRTWLAADGKVADEIGRLRDAAMRHDPAATNDASAAMQAAGLDGTRAAAALGLQTCAVP